VIIAARDSRSPVCLIKIASGVSDHQLDLQEMMVWMSRKSICVLDSMVEDYASEVGQVVLIFTHSLVTNPTQQPPWTAG
jgi:hypothetical protein